jgi:PERQ amino acid-rich with GYF domain-containing protein
MPTNLPSSFASAAAGQNANRAGRGGSGSDWARRDGRSANGTLTLRRSSTTPLSQTPQPPPSSDNAVQLPGLDHQAQPSTYELSPARYSKDELLAISQFPRSNEPVSRLLAPGWNPDQVNGGGSRAWGKSNENHVPQEPGACWDETGDNVPRNLQPVTEAEREVRFLHTYRHVNVH